MAQPTATSETARILQEGVVSHRAGDLDGAARAYRKVLKKNPRDPDALHLLGLVLSQGGNAQDGAESIKQALAIRDDFPDAHLNVGLIFAKAGSLTEAERHFRRALHFRPAAVNTHLELVRILRYGDDAQVLFDATQAALRVAPQNAVLQIMAAEALFALGRLREGWRAYRARFQSSENPVAAKTYPLPPWQGEPLAHRAILIWTEQAPGDEIMYANMLPDIIAAAGRCVVQCSPRLAPLFRRSFPKAEIHDRDLTQAALEGIDFQSPIGSLAEWLRPDFAAFPARAGYLKADPDLRARLRTKYDGGDGKKLVVGISWRSAAPINGADKSLNVLDWGPIFHVPGTVFVNLQYGRSDAELAAVRTGFGVTVINDDAIDSLKDLDGYAAQVAAMDIVVSSSNTAAHVAGGLGVPVLCMLPSSLGRGRRWYWFAARGACPWYPALRMFPQNAGGGWSDVIRDTGLALLDVAAARCGFEPAPYLRAVAQAFVKVGRTNDAEVYYRRLSREPGRMAEGLFQIAELKKAAEPDAAMALYDQAIAADPHFWHAYNAKGRLLNTQRRFEDAAAVFQEGLRHSAAPEMRSNLGSALARLGHRDDALRELRQAFADSRDAADAVRDSVALNYAGSLSDSGDPNQAIDVLRDLIQNAPAMVDAHYNLGLILLSLGRFGEGWPEFAWRLKRPNMVPYVFSPPRWNGEDITRKKVLIWTEQGLGDEILAANMVPDALAKARHVVLLCSARLVPLMRRSFPKAQVIERKDPLPKAAVAADIDFQMSMSDLGLAFRRGFEDFPRRDRLLTADPVRRDALRKRYASRRPGAPIVGVSWSSKHNHEVGWLKSTDLAAWRPILETPGVTFVNLQYGDWRRELADMHAHAGIEILDDPDVDALTDMDAFAAQVAAMDLVISVSNTTVHVAGALGVPTWVMPPEGRGRLWYWFRDRTDSPWYSSVRLLAQDGAGWPSAIARLAVDLGTWVKENWVKGRDVMK
ncbi:MAG: tetratricopeptide repeat protein [Rhodospirillaceae bacterium]